MGLVPEAHKRLSGVRGQTFAAAAGLNPREATQLKVSHVSSDLQVKALWCQEKDLVSFFKGWQSMDLMGHF